MFRSGVSIFSGICAFVLVTVIATGVVWADDWEHVHTSEDVRVYERDSGDDVAFRGVMEADVSIGEVVAVYIDPDQRRFWVSNYGNHTTFDSDEDSELYWLRLDMPFGVSDRDYLLRSDYRFNEDDRTVDAIARSVESDAVPERDCCVRAETRTEYTFEAIEGSERTRIEVVVESDLKGRVPDRIVESAQRDWPVDTLTALVDRASRSSVEPDSRVEGWHEE